MDTRTVLVVDDDQGFRDNLKDILEEHGYRILSAGTCSEALKVAVESRPMAALLDIKLPDGPGTSLLGNLRLVHKECVCAMMTAFADLSTALAALEQGAFQYLQKPVRPAELLNMLERIFDTIRLKQEKIRAEEKLRQSENMLRSLLDAYPSDALLIDPEGNILAANRQVANHLGKGPREVEGMNTAILAPEEVQATRRVKGLEAIHTRAPVRFEESVNGRIMDTIINPVIDAQNRVTCMAVFSQDVTEIKLAEKERQRLEQNLSHSQRLEAIGTLAGGVAHDFNNLLQAIMGYTEMLIMERTSGDPDYAKLRKVETAAQRARDLTQQLLTFGRKTESRPRPLDLNREVRQVENLLRRTIPKMIDIELMLKKGLWVVEADPAQVEQILMNLAINARDAMPEQGKLTIGTDNVTLDESFCRMFPDCAAGNYVLLRVTDTGRGMDTETLEHIFEPFFTTKEIGKGTGLGLATVYGIVRKHKGIVLCESQPGRGATFLVYLPATNSWAGNSEIAAENAPPPRGSERILIVDDEKTILDVIEMVLEKHGYKVVKAANGESALELYEKSREAISLVLLDLIMPGMGGKRCLQELLRRDPQLKVVVASGYAGDDPPETLLEIGAKEFVKKPYDLRNLLGVIRDVLDEKRYGKGVKC
ncbi:MAG: response regulator [Desulfobacteraceae bacterium]|nr:MAG: response regulator [Desulfobacteraceae bacterium]